MWRKNSRSLESIRDHILECELNKDAFSVSLKSLLLDEITDADFMMLGNFGFKDELVELGLGEEEVKERMRIYNESLKHNIDLVKRIRKKCYPGESHRLLDVV